ncbi:M56 family metallopeptidase [Paenibacillus sp. UNC217MF]|uniref:M56 family metallopeptidase n=1 Tax=Paenibacillus sp. UNC217MF TaxID=1449062 RepID=UPI00069016B6|nr:M56 family metallopeptidase [Paenibacillus sp. UNC217MF]
MGPTLHASLLSFFGWLIRGSFMAGILVLLILTLQFLLKNKLEARWKYLIWLPVAIRLLLPWAPESSLSLYNVFSLKDVAPGIHQMTHDPQVLRDAGRAGKVAVHGERYVQPETGGTSEMPALSHESETVQGRGFWWNRIKQLGFINGLMLVWLAGGLFLAAKTVYDQLRLKRALRAGRVIDTPFLSGVFQETKQRLGINRNVRFVASERIPGPAVVGFHKPAIVIAPSLLVTLQKEQLQYILAHEFAHIQRRDVIVNWVIHVILILHWFNPLIWLAAHKARQAQEMACDACVLDRMDPQQNRAYGQTIIHVLEHVSGSHHQPGLASLSSTHKEMKRRLMMIKQFNKKSYRLSILGIGMILALGSVTLVNARESNAASAPVAAAVQEQQKSDKKEVQIDKTMKEKLNKVVKQFAGKDIKLQDVGEMIIDSNKVNAEVKSVDGKYKIQYSTKTGGVWSVSGLVPINKISKKDQEKAIQELKKRYPKKTYAFGNEVKAIRVYDDKKAVFNGEVWYTFKGKDFEVLLVKSKGSSELESMGYMIKVEAQEIEGKLLKTAADAVKTALDQEFNFTEAKLIPGEFDFKNNINLSKWELEGNGVLVEIEAESGKVLNVIHKTTEKVKTDKEIPVKEAKEVIAPMAKKLFNIDITGYEVKRDNLFGDYCFFKYDKDDKGAKAEATIVRAALDADKNVVYLMSGSRAASGGY